MARHRRDEGWAEARRLCRLSADVAKAKALGFQPKSLIRNIPLKSQPWKAPVRLRKRKSWIEAAKSIAWEARKIP